MSDAVATVATAGTAQILLERSPQASRTIAALRYTLEAMHSERSAGADSARLSPDAPTFAEEIRRQAARSEPPPVARTSTVAAPLQRATPIAPPATPVATRTSPEWQAPEAPASVAPPAEDLPLDLMQWTRSAGNDELPPVTFEEPAPAGVIAPDLARLAEAEQNRIPRDVLEIMRERHLGPTAAQSPTGRPNER